MKISQTIPIYPLIWSLLLLSPLYLVAQNTYPNNDEVEKLVLLPNTLPSHPMGLFTMRMKPIIHRYSPNKKRLQFHTSAANIWVPELEIYKPIKPSKELLETINPLGYTSRLKYLLQNNIPVEHTSFSADGVVRSFQLEYYQMLDNQHEIGVSMQGHWLTGGQEFFHFPVSDELIEGFHDIFTDPDQFSRKEFPFNQARIAYRDADGNAFSLKKNDVWASGMELYYGYHIPIKNTPSKLIYANVNSRLFVPLTNVHPYTSLGIGVNGVGHFIAQQKHAFDVTLSAGLLRQRLWKWRTGTTFDVRDIQMNVHLYLGYARHFSRNRFFSIGIQNQTQNSWYNNKGMKPHDRFGGLAMTGHFLTKKDAIRWWNQSALALYTYTQSWSLIFGYRTQKWGISLYWEEDFWVNNAPDLQTGITIQKTINVQNSTFK